MLQIKTLKQIILNGGATLNKNGTQKNYKKGYQVSKKDCYKLQLKNINEILKATNKLLKSINDNEYVGLWVDCDCVYIDISIKINNRLDAINQGLTLNQLSIFDWSNNYCIWL